LNVRHDWLYSILVQTGVADVNGDPNPNTTAQDVLNIILLYYVAHLMRRLSVAAGQGLK